MIPASQPVWPAGRLLDDDDGDDGDDDDDIIDDDDDDDDDDADADADADADDDDDDADDNGDGECVHSEVFTRDPHHATRRSRKSFVSSVQPR